MSWFPELYLSDWASSFFQDTQNSIYVHKYYVYAFTVNLKIWWYEFVKGFVKGYESTAR